jgi:hypothetical protein
MAQPLAALSASQSFQNLLDTVVAAIPKILVFLIVLAIGWIVARVLARVVDLLLRRVRFDRFAEHGVIGRVLARSNADATTLISRITFYAILLITLQLAFGVFGTNPISTMIDGIVAWLPRAIVAIIIVVIASAIAQVVKNLIVATIGGLSYGLVLANVASITIITLGAIAALNQAGIAAGVTQPVLYAVLLTAGAVVAIGVGGGLIRPMQDRWERMLTAAERETTRQVGAYRQGRPEGARRAPVQASSQRPEPPTAVQQAAPEGSTSQSTSIAPDPGEWRESGSTRF